MSTKSRFFIGAIAIFFLCSAASAASKQDITLLEAATTPCLMYGEKGELLQRVEIKLENSSARSQQVKIYVDGELNMTFNIPSGTVALETGITEPVKEKARTVAVYQGGKLVGEQQIVSFPVKKWTIFLVQHTHTDIGYTKRQTEILTEHLRYIDYAVEYCELTENYPDDAKFRWTCESSWAVDEYLKSRPKEQIDKLRKYVDNGQIELAAMYFNMSEIVDENSLKAFLAPVKRFKEMGFPVKTAMQNDVNGIAWCLADYLPALGVDYMWMGSNTGRAMLPFDMPTVYRWESPSGKAVISYRADHYHTGNHWGIHEAEVEKIQPGMFKYLAGLDNKGYPYDAVSVQYSGYFTDNSPPSYKQSDLIKEWNNRYAWPKLRSAVAGEFLDYVSENYSEGFETYRTAYPDWWTDGFGTAARETAASRETHVDMIAVEGLLSLARAKDKELPEHIANNIGHVHEKVLFYDEHTFGAAESLSDPFCENTMVQWAEKSAYVWEAKKSGKMLYETAAGLLQNDLRRGQHPTLTFFNTMAAPRSQMHTIYIDFEVVPSGSSFRLMDEHGKELRVQKVRDRREGSYYTVYAEDIPAMGYRTFDMVISANPRSIKKEEEDITSNILENEFYRITVDGGKGAISGLYDKELGLEMCDDASEWMLGSLIYERLGSRRELNAHNLENYTRSGLENCVVKAVTDGAVCKSIMLEGHSDGTLEDSVVKVEIKLYHGIKRIEIEYSLRRTPETDPSGFYVAFPWKLPRGRLAVEVQGGTLYPGENQLPRSTTAWYTAQNFVSANGPEAQFIVGSDAVPLWQLGSLLGGPTQQLKSYEKPYAYSWVMNNYWNTNFRAMQEGEFKWSYYITSAADTSVSAATRFGWGSRVPLYARVMPVGKENALPSSYSAFSIPAPNLLMTSCTLSATDGYLLLNVRELDGRAENLWIIAGDGTIMEFEEVNTAEEILGQKTDRLEFKPFENKFVRLKL